MQATQKQAIESYQRVQVFLANHPPPESPGYTVQKKTLDEVLTALNEHAVGQLAGLRLVHAEVRRQGALRKVLREDHLRPISKIARATLADAPGIERALRMPSYALGSLKLIADAQAMRDAAAQYAAQFVEAGRPTDFLQQLDKVAAELLESMMGRARHLGRQVGARAGIAKEIRRGRRTIELLDTIVTTSFSGNQNVLAKWHNARRVQGVPGATGAGDAFGDLPTRAALIAAAAGSTQAAPATSAA